MRCSAICSPLTSSHHLGPSPQVGFKCIGNVMGFAKCPAGMTSCFLASWHRPLCATKASNCKALELFAFAHKLQKRACPAA